MEFRYKHWCGRAERGRTRAPPCQRAKNINKKMKKMNDDNEWSINYNNINSNDDDEDGDDINGENEIHVGAHMLCSVT